ncbi:hypothetical protein [Nocardia sp. alder85J]|uniref:DUF7064 domain-containing protein n=1 Tax=Nocardia sp. alder85J TaxID=2862949 RepID=UPI001CD5A68E|nr:hypothetical protein [Nocardia sp. alder85J]MCX4096817.1 hypothetical protein [Nocardia sp. alder85J]
MTASAHSMFTEALAPEHEYRHAPDDDPAYNESTYYNFAGESGVVGFLRVAMQQNQPSGQATALIFVPDGPALFFFERTTAISADELAVGGVRIEVLEPHRRQRLSFAGRMAAFEDPRVLADPGTALRTAPREEVAVDLTVTGHGVSFGTSGTDPSHVLEDSLAVGHYEQFIRLDGDVRVGDRTLAVRGGGLRDHSWGPRDWSGPLFYRWVTATFEDGSAVMALEVARRDGVTTRRAAAVTGGAAAEAELTAVTVDRTEDGFGHRVACEFTTAAGGLVVTGVARQPARFVPLRHVTTAPDGTRSVTRIGYSAYEFTASDGRRGLGIVEMLDQLPAGAAEQEGKS